MRRIKEYVVGGGILLAGGGRTSGSGGIARELASVDELGHEGLRHGRMVNHTSMRVAFFVPVYSFPRCPNSFANIGWCVD
jgi:hypothetical protein